MIGWIQVRRSWQINLVGEKRMEIVTKVGGKNKIKMVQMMEFVRNERWEVKCKTREGRMVGRRKRSLREGKRGTQSKKRWMMNG